MCYYIARNKLFKPFKLFLLLKKGGSGKIMLKNYDFEKLLKDMGYKSSRSINNNLKILQKLNWIGLDEK